MSGGYAWYRTSCGRSGKTRIGNHLLYGLNAGDGLFRKCEAESDGAQQLAVDVDRTSAHALQDAGFREWAAAEPSEDDGLFWSQIFEEAEDFDLEFVDTVALEHGFTDAVKTRAHIAERENCLGRDGCGCEKQKQSESELTGDRASDAGMAEGGARLASGAAITGRKKSQRRGGSGSEHISIVPQMAF